MSNPFPGIDPYLEAQRHWQDFHARFLTYARDAINDGLPARYRARLEERFTIAMVEAERESQPDVTILRDDAAPVPARSAASAPGFWAEPVIMSLPTLIDEDVTERWIEVRRQDRTIVSVIELLSPSNKSGDGRTRYLDKRRALIQEAVHLIELDFLIDGQRLPMKQPLPDAHYYALVSRAARRPSAEVFAWTIRQPLPAIPIPLDPPDADLPLDLGGLYAAAHERGRYDRDVRRGSPLGLPLTPLDLEWAESLA